MSDTMARVPKDTAVLVILGSRGGKLSVLTVFDNSKQALTTTGGLIDPTDGSSFNAAVREAREESGWCSIVVEWTQIASRLCDSISLNRDGRRIHTHIIYVGTIADNEFNVVNNYNPRQFGNTETSSMSVVELGSLISSDRLYKYQKITLVAALREFVGGNTQASNDQLAAEVQAKIKTMGLIKSEVKSEVKQEVSREVGKKASIKHKSGVYAPEQLDDVTFGALSEQTTENGRVVQRRPWKVAGVTRGYIYDASPKDGLIVHLGMELITFRGATYIVTDKQYDPAMRKLFSMIVAR